MKIYIIDNYDSFTYNLYQFIGEILTAEKNQGNITDFEIIVKRNDQVSLDEIRLSDPDRIIISPGPGSPDDENYFGICAQVIEQFGPETPLLGVCLGMQGIVHVFGGKVVKAQLPMHGKISPITHDGQGMFCDIPDQLEVMRYHSLMAESESFPDSLRLTAVVGDLPLSAFNQLEKIRAGGDFEIMAIQHKQHPIYGIQFHPESFATEGGKELIKNFLFCQ
ncbi:aminodeoxychorismate/anthranilate synthase component II [Motiliproteus sp. MSK22-1]|uniref:anthranilate synthase component II n=1 Tax=Motiliproteus sp. MSK22-1 TaxID=1897630 RepID=UPI0009775D8F|nr:aminodeoxychorismate/anthranilate synthase component II [Motiliproteus sp. MSK22-1]OMH38876.1 anthranilate/aminodeoxychorismate synthase component II [Motiliproteus sp. MSK22-1]